MADGRGVLPQDLLSAPTLTVVNQEFVKNFFKQGENPIGHRIGPPGPQRAGDFEIVGVADDTTYVAVQWRDHAMFFVPITQRPASDKKPIDTDISFHDGAIVIEAHRPMNDLEKLAQLTLSKINPNLTFVKFQTFDQQIAGRFNYNRMIAQLTSLFGGLALLLARIRMAFGAERTRVIGMVMRGAMTQTFLGLIGTVVGTQSFFTANQRDKRDPYSIQWNLSVERTLHDKTAACACRISPTAVISSVGDRI